MSGTYQIKFAFLCIVLVHSCTVLCWCLPCHVFFAADNPCSQPSPCDDVNGYCNLVDQTEECSCKRGYTLNALNSSICEEVDECLLGIDACAQKCANTEGGYSCSCNPGYTISSNRLGCDGKSAKISRLWLSLIVWSYLFWNYLSLLAKLVWKMKALLVPSSLLHPNVAILQYFDIFIVIQLCIMEEFWFGMSSWL